MSASAALSRRATLSLPLSLPATRTSRVRSAAARRMSSRPPRSAIPALPLQCWLAVAALHSHAPLRFLALSTDAHSAVMDSSSSESEDLGISDGVLAGTFRGTPGASSPILAGRPRCTHMHSPVLALSTDSNSSDDLEIPDGVRREQQSSRDRCAANVQPTYDQSTLDQSALDQSDQSAIEEEMEIPHCVRREQRSQRDSCAAQLDSDGQCSECDEALNNGPTMKGVMDAR